MIKTFYFNELRTACYLLWDNTKECAIVDPGCATTGEQLRLAKFIEENTLQPKMLINTHGHFDHVMGNAFVSKKWNLQTHLSKKDISELEKACSYGSYFGYEFEQPPLNIIDINDGDVLQFGNTTLECRLSPGHTQGGTILYNKAENYLITGDSLFKGSIGRTDLPGGDYDMLAKSLKEVILKFPSETVVYPGHGPETTIAEEIIENPFLQF